jgi:hypothetical protein
VADLPLIPKCVVQTPAEMKRPILCEPQRRPQRSPQVERESYTAKKEWSDLPQTWRGLSLATPDIKRYDREIIKMISNIYGMDAVAARIN